MANLADYDTRGDAPFRVQQRVHLHPTDCQKNQESSRGPQPFRPGSARLHLLPLFHKKGSANIQRGHGTVFASENPIFQRKKRFLAGSASEKSSIFSGDWRGWQWRGSLLPRPPACQNFFDKLSAPTRWSGRICLIFRFDPAFARRRRRTPPPCRGRSGRQ